jgi:hypothetical protein
MAYTISTGVSIYGVVAFIRDDDGLPQIVGELSAGQTYAGLRAYKARALTVTPAEPQRISARGDGKTYLTFNEPPTETPSGELRTQALDTDLIALLTSVKDYGSLNRHMTPLSTDKLGEEEPIMLYGWRKAADTDPTSVTFGQRSWECYFLLNCMASVRPPTFEDSQIGEVVWNLTANNSSVDQYGRSLTENIHGCTEMAFAVFTSRYRIAWEVGIGTGAQSTFTLSKGTQVIHDDANYPVIAAVDGSLVTVSGVSSAGVVTLASPPGDGDKVLLEYSWN